MNESETRLNILIPSSKQAVGVKLKDQKVSKAHKAL